MIVARFDLHKRRAPTGAMGSGVMRGKASSGYDRETIIRRLQAIRDDLTPEAKEERRFLRGVLSSKFPEE